MAYSIRQNPASSTNYGKGRNGKKVDKLLIHTGATTNYDSIAATFKRKSRTSAHYGVGRNNNVDQYVSEADTAWHAGNLEANRTSIGIENVNSSGAPNWSVAPETFETLVELVRDIATRNGLLPLRVGVNLFPHSHFTATACPTSLKPRLQELADRVNGSTTTPAPQPAPAPVQPAKPAATVYGKGYITNSPVIGSIAKFMRATFPAYTSSKALGNYWGQYIESSIKQFQRRTGLESDGRVGPLTQAKLKQYGWKG